MRDVASTVDLVLHTVEGAHRSGRGIAVAQTVEEHTVMTARSAGWGSGEVEFLARAVDDAVGPDRVATQGAPARRGVPGRGFR